jgi:hypothetical protein
MVSVVPNVPIVPTPTSLLPRDAGEDKGGGLNGLTDLNVRSAEQELKNGYETSCLAE